MDVRTTGRSANLFESCWCFFTRHDCRGSIQAVAAACLLVALCACTSDLPATQVTSHQDASVEAFFQKLKADKSGTWLGEEATDYVENLPPQSRTAIAARAVDHPDTAVQFFGMGQLYALGDDAGGDRVAANLLVRGVDLTGLSWSWMHSGDPTLMERRLAGISRALLTRYDALNEGERTLANKFLCELHDDCDIESLRLRYKRPNHDP